MTLLLASACWLGSPSLVAAQSNNLAIPDCLSNQQYIATCSELSPTVVCSPQLTSLCCGCQGVWGASFDYCVFNIALFPTPTPTPTATPTPVIIIPDQPVIEPEIVPTPITFPCLGGVDSNGDGIIDASGEPCGLGGDCIDYDITQSEADLVLGAGDLTRLSNRALKRLVKNGKKASDKSIGTRLQNSSKRVRKLLAQYEAGAVASIAQLPNTFSVCPTTLGCLSVDNTESIRAYIEAVSLLTNTSIRALNRATRLTSKSVKAARKKTDKQVKALKLTRDKLIEQAGVLPKYQSSCGGNN